MRITDKAKEKLGAVGEWVAYFTPLIVMFGFFITQNVHMNARIDETIRSTNARIDETIRSTNARADTLHQEFMDLLKEMRRDKERK